VTGPSPLLVSRAPTDLALIDEHTAWSGAIPSYGLRYSVDSWGFGLRDPLVLEGEVRWDCQPLPR